VPASQLELFIPHKALCSPQAVRAVLADQYPRPSDAAHLLQRSQTILTDEDRRPHLNEESHRAEFLTDVFSHLLGYRTVGSADAYNMRREVSGPEDDRPADAVLGFLGNVDDEWVRTVVEVKPPAVQLIPRMIWKSSAS
jgi:hypothetical protein